MSSPVNYSFVKHIVIDRKKAEPIYLQIVYRFIQAVQLQLLNDGDRIPGSRVLSEKLKVHRKTIVMALEELKTQGWIYTRPSVGTFVKNPELKENINRTHHFLSSDSSNFSFRRSFILDRDTQHIASSLQFTDGTPDYRLLKINELARFYSTVLNRKSNRSKFSNSSEIETSFFKEQLSFYIKTSYDLYCSKENLLVADNKHVLLYILTQLMIQTGDRVLIGRYSCSYANMIFQQAGAKVLTLPMDEQGIKVNHIREHFKVNEIKLLYIQTNHQYPTTKCMSEKRQKELIQLSKELDFVIIEDGSMYELTYNKLNLNALVHQNFNGKVIYIGDYGSFLIPGYQNYYIIAAKDFIQEAQKYLTIFGEIDPFKKRALGEMISEGDIHRYRRKAIHTYETRRNIFSSLLKKHSALGLKFSEPQGGLAFWITFTKHLSLSHLVKTCYQNGLYIPRNCQYQSPENIYLRLGFGHFNEKEMEKALQLFGKSLREVMY